MLSKIKTIYILLRITNITYLYNLLCILHFYSNNISSKHTSKEKQNVEFKNLLLLKICRCRHSAYFLYNVSPIFKYATLGTSSVILNNFIISNIYSFNVQLVLFLKSYRLTKIYLFFSKFKQNISLYHWK